MELRSYIHICTYVCLYILQTSMTILHINMLNGLRISTMLLVIKPLTLNMFCKIYEDGWMEGEARLSVSVCEEKIFSGRPRV